jgi:flagellar hook-length control protein FliK
MEQPRIASQQPSQNTHAAARSKTAAKSNEATQDAGAQGGFMALMAALGEGLSADSSADTSAEQAGVDLLTDAQSTLAGQMYDPTALSQVQGFFATLTGSAAAGTGLAGAAGSMANNGLAGGAGGAGASWGLDALGTGLVAQTSALDGAGDMKDGDAAAALLTQGRSLAMRGTTSFAQRSDALSALAGNAAGKGAVSDASRPALMAADSLLAPAQNASAPSLREAMPGQGGVGRDSALAGGLLGSSATASPSSLADSIAALAPAGSSARESAGDMGSTTYGGEGAWGAQTLDSGPTLGDPLVPEVFTPPGAEEALAEQVTYWVNQKTQNAEMTLTRDGQPVEVLVSLSGNEAHVTFRSDQEHTRQMLDGSMAQLSDMLRDQGLILTGSSVGTSAGDGKSSGSNASQERNSRAGQTKVAAAEGGGGQPRISQDGRSAIDVFV